MNNTITTEKRRKNALRLVVLAVICIATSFCASAQLPSVHLKDIDGKLVDTATLSNDGKPFVISFWATWCKPCRRELKAIAEVYDEWQEETGMRLIAVSTDDAQNISKVKPVVDASSWEYQVLLDPSGEFSRAMGVGNVPHTVLVDGKGNIVESHAGYTDGSEEHLIEMIRELIAKSETNTVE
jgi:peroxiredoxin